MLQCSQPPWMTAGLRPRWISAATRLVGPLFGKSLDFRAVRIRFPVEPRQVAAGASSQDMKIETLSIDFTDEQKRFLEGFTSGLQISRAGLGGGASTKSNAEPTGPDAAHIKAQNKIL